MKTFLYIAVVSLSAACSPRPQSDASATCFKGRLVKRGICGQRVVQLLSAPADAVVMAREWTDSLSGKKYENVFTVGNLCNFSASIAEGEVFDFSITTEQPANCVTCYAYTPVPREKNNIAVGCKP